MSITAEPRQAAALAALWPALALVLPLFLSVLAGELILKGGEDKTVHFADAEDAAAVARGAGLYQENCAACHGARLEGQPGWQVVGADGVVRAPPQDDSGHAWMHSDEDLFSYVKYGLADYLPPGLTADMPAFGERLTDAQIEDTLAFIKSHWSVGNRAYQALLNPGHAGMPALGSAGSWVLPADCRFELIRPRLRPAAAKQG
ncbi:MAG TPA: cytochrome c [Stellaceae bacterium]|nr:cytochrome c [Stellaceae bacterium]